MKTKPSRAGDSPLYSKEWMKKRYLVERKTAQEIATELDTSIMQVYRWLDRHGLR